MKKSVAPKKMSLLVFIIWVIFSLALLGFIAYVGGEDNAETRYLLKNVHKIYMCSIPLYALAQTVIRRDNREHRVSRIVICCMLFVGVVIFYFYRR